MPNKKSRVKHAPPVEFDLPPTAKAAAAAAAAAGKPNPKKRRKPRSTDDDTPKAFLRLLAGPARSGLDDGPKTKKQKKAEDLTKVRETLKIQPNESLRDFSKRVDAAIPVKFPKGEGKLQLQEEKRKEKEDKKKKAEEPTSEDDEDLSEEEDPEEDIWKEVKEARGSKKKGGKLAKRGESPDPWAELEKKREKIKFGEVAEAPPQLKKPREVFKVYKGAGVNVEGVPKAAGSLMKREELASERRNVVEAYRQMMEERRDKSKMPVKYARLGPEGGAARSYRRAGRGLDA